MKKIVGIFLMVLAAVSLFACGKEESKGNLPEKVRIGTQTLADPEAIAKAEGWLEKDLGVPVDIVKFDGGRDVNLAMASGEIDFGILGSVPASLAIANGVDCKVIYIQSVLGEIESLVMKEDLNISKAEDLKGKTIATVFSSTSHYSLLKYLETNQIDRKDVDVIDMKASEIVAAFQRGDIDGAFIWDPQVSEMLNLGGKIFVSAADVADLGYATMDVEIVNKGFAEKYPEIVQNYVNCMEKAVKLYKEDETKAGESVSKDLGLTPKECLRQMKTSSWLTVEEQGGVDWFGDSKLSENLYETAQFLYKQGDVLTEPEKGKFTNAVDGKFLEN